VPGRGRDQVAAARGLFLFECANSLFLQATGSRAGIPSTMA
jgi:hypothetical protein